MKQEDSLHRELMLHSISSIPATPLEAGKQKEITKALLDKSYLEDFYLKIFKTDKANYKDFNDIEMIYLYIHEEKDQDENKNTMANTKREYVRDLLQTYMIFNQNREQFGIPYIEGSIFNELHEKQIRIYQNWLKTAPLGKGNKPYAIATISRKTTIFKSFLHYIYRKGYINQPVHEYFIAARVGKNDRPNRDITQDEVIQLLDYYRDNPIVHCLLAVLVTTGARIEELSNVKVSDLTYENDTKTNESNYWMEVTGKRNKKRSLLIHDNVFEAIVRFRERRRLKTLLSPIDHSPLFTTPKGKKYNYKNLSAYIIKHMNTAEVPFVQMNNILLEQFNNGTLAEQDKDKIRTLSPHTLRHGFAIISAENDNNVFKLMQTMGHESIDTTMIYLENRQSKEQNVGHSWKGNDLLEHIKL